MSLSQIGEFSFIIASLGVSLNVTNDFLYPIAVAVSAITTFTTPFFIKKSTHVYSFVEKKLPERWLNGLNSYSTGSQQLSAYSEWKELLNGYFINAGIHTVLIGGLIFISQKYIDPFISNAVSDSLIATILSVGLSLIFMIPFIWALATRRIKKEAYSNL
jgi:CPA2 family monovalent cation:H+ antiporter-2